jgi:uncharacterized protein with PhoU and TrkA domain
MRIDSLIRHFERFSSGADRSVQWAKDAESILDQLDASDQILVEAQELLSLYRPEGGPHLVGEAEMTSFVHRAMGVLSKLP